MLNSRTRCSLQVLISLIQMTEHFKTANTSDNQENVCRQDYGICQASYLQRLMAPVRLWCLTFLLSVAYITQNMTQTEQRHNSQKCGVCWVSPCGAYRKRPASTISTYSQGYFGYMQHSVVEAWNLATNQANLHWDKLWFGDVVCLLLHYETSASPWEKFT